MFDKNSGSGDTGMIHDDEELILCTKGAVKFKAGEEEVIIKKGDILLVKSNVPHSWQNHSNKESEVFLINATKEKQEMKLHDIF